MATVKGVWVFNETIDGSLYDSQTISFTSNSSSFTNINDYDNPTAMPAHTYGYVNYNNTKVYGGSSVGWINQAYRTVDFGSTEQEVSDEFYAWFTANATQQASEEEASGVTITYNGSTIASLETGQTATLECAGKKAKSDIVVAFASAGSVTYNGKTTEVEAGKTATLACAGKKMLSDVVIAVGSSASLISFTIDTESYQAEEGMTWAEWVGSDYNTGGFISSYGEVVTDYGYFVKDLESNHIYSSDVIADGGTYKTESGGSND